MTRPEQTIRARAKEWRRVDRLIRRRSAACNVSLVRLESKSKRGGDGSNALIHGAHRGCRPEDRASFGKSLCLLSLSSPVVPCLLDRIEGDTAVITSWAAAPSRRSIERQSGDDSLLSHIQNGDYFSPWEALRTLSPLGALLDQAALLDCFPLEFGPDHLIYNAGSVRLVGFSRHGYARRTRSAPSPAGRSPACSAILGDDVPEPSDPEPVWRASQVRAFQRLAGWMISGRNPRRFGATTSAEGLDSYLENAGFLARSPIRPRHLEEDLETWATEEEAAQAKAAMAATEVLVLYDDSANHPTREHWSAYAKQLVGMAFAGSIKDVDTGRLFVQLDPTPEGDRISGDVFVHYSEADDRHGDLTASYSPGQQVVVKVKEAIIDDRFGLRDGRPRLRMKGTVKGKNTPQPLPTMPSPLLINPESIRLGLLRDRDAAVTPIAAFDRERAASLLGVQLGSAGWILLDPEELQRTVPAFVERRRRARSTLAVVVVGRCTPTLSERLGSIQHLVPPGATITIAGRDWTELPFVQDSDLFAYQEGFFTGDDGQQRGGHSRARRTFAAGWMARLVGSTRNLDCCFKAAEMFPGRPRLVLVLVEELLAHGGNPRESLRMLEEVRGLLLSLPRLDLMQRDVIRAVLGRSDPNKPRLIRALKRNFAPVAGALSALWHEPEVRRMLGTASTVTQLGRMGAAVAKLRGRVEEKALTELVLRNADSLLFELAGLLRGEVMAAILGDGQSETTLDLARALVGDRDRDLLSAITIEDWTTLRNDKVDPKQLELYGPGLALLLRHRTISLRILESLASSVDTGIRSLLRALLRQPPRRWSLVAAHQRIVERWWRVDGSFAILGACERIPELDQWMDRLTDEGLRAVVTSRLDRPTLELCEGFARSLTLDLDVALREIADVPESIDLASVDIHREPNRSFTRHYVREIGLSRTIQQLESGAASRWAVFGADGVAEPSTTMLSLARAVSATVEQLEMAAGTTPPDAILERLSQDPLLSRALRAVPPAARLRLLSHVPELPIGSERLDLQNLADVPAPSATASLAIESGQSVATTARLLRSIDGLDRVAEVRTIGPIVFELPEAIVRELLSPGIEPDSRPWLALAGRRRPELVRVASVFGSRVVPFLLGDDGGAVADTLSRVDPQPGTVHWLVRAGRVGLDVLGRVGGSFTAILELLSPPPCDTLLLERAWNVAGGEPTAASRLYRLATAHGIAVQYWPTVFDLIGHGKKDAEIVHHLFVNGAS